MIIGGARRARNAASRQGVHLAAGGQGDGAARPRRRPWWVWAVPFAAVFGVLLARNAFLFSTPLYEDSDMGANSILIEQARRFTLLVGQYSREGFNHPGPAFLYVQSWGESLLWAALRLVPTAWNGQLIAVYALNALFAALVVAVGYGQARSVRTAAVGGAAVLALAAVRPDVFSSDWMPYVVVPPFVAFLVGIASVAAGRLGDAWIAALAGWFLINGNVAFLFLVPLLAGGCLVALAWPRRRRLGAAARSFFARRRRVWVPVVVISVVFAFPIVLNTALHWPGEFGKYLAYSSASSPSAPTGPRGLTQVADYVLWYWWPGGSAVRWLVPVAAYGVAAVAVWRMAPGQVRRFCASLVAFDVLASAAFVFYAAVEIDTLDVAGRYIGYIYWAAPAIALLVILLAVTESLPPAGGLAVAVAAAVAAFSLFAVAPQTRTSTDYDDPISGVGTPTDPALPAAVARLAALAAGRPVVLYVPKNSWPAMTGLLVQAERTGVTACVTRSALEFIVTRKFVCTPAESTGGAWFGLYAPDQVPPGMRVVVRLRTEVVASQDRA